MSDRARRGRTPRPGSTDRLAGTRALAVSGALALAWAGAAWAQPAGAPQPSAAGPSAPRPPAAPAAQSPAGTGAAPLRAPTEATAPAPLGPLLTEATEQLARGEARTAYALLAPNLRWYAGDPVFDHLLGVAAIDAGEPAAAVLAFERVLAVRPDHLQARAELARALLAVNEVEAARREFEVVAAQRIPPQVQAVVDAYLARIAVVEREARISRQGWVEIGTGWDSNVTLGSLGDQWLLAGGTAVTPLASSRPRETALLSWGAGLEWQGPIDGGWRWTAGGQAMGRSNASAHTLDQTLIDFTGGLRYRTGCHGIDMLAQLQHLRVDGASFRDAAGVLAQWRCDLDARTQVGFYLQQFAFRFPDQRVRDARRQIAGFTFARAFGGPLNPVLIGNVYGGRERPDDDIPQLEHRFHGLRTVLSASLSARWRGWLGLSWESRDFAGAEPLFDAVRHDRQTEAEIGASYQIDRSWSLTPRLIHTRNASTLAPNDFRRSQALVSAQYRF